MSDDDLCETARVLFYELVNCPGAGLITDEAFVNMATSGTFALALND